MLKTVTKLMALALATSVLAGCGGGGSDGPGLVFVRAVNTVADAPALNVTADDYVYSGALYYGTASNFSIDSFNGNSGSRRIRIAPVVPGGEVGEVVLDQQVTFRRDTEATVVLTGSLDDMAMMVVETPRRWRPLDQAYMQFAHAAQSVGAVDVYVTPPDTDLTSTAPLYTVQPGSYTESLEVPFEDLVVRLTRAGTLDVVFESDTLQLEDDPDLPGDGVEFLMTITDTLSPGASSVKLIAGNSNGGTAVFADLNAVAGLRVVHAAPDTPTFDVVVGDDFANPIGTNIAYKDATAMAAVPGGLVNLNFTVPGSSTEFVFEEQVNLAADSEHTLYLLQDYNNPVALTVATSRRSVLTEGRVRFVHGSRENDFLSLYLGETASDPPPGTDRKLIDIPFGAASGYLSIEPGDYKLTVTERYYAPGTNPSTVEGTVVIGPVDISIAGGDVTTLLVLPPETPGGPPVLQVYDDLAL